jgi:hypothetical protein
MRYIYYYCFKGNDSRLALKSLVYELPNCRCIASRTTYLSVWRLLILINNLQEWDVEFIWSVCGPDMNLGWKGAFASIQMISSLFMFIYCVYLEDTEENRKIVFKTFNERHHPRERQSGSSMTRVRTSGLRARIRRDHNI